MNKLALNEKDVQNFSKKQAQIVYNSRYWSLSFSQSTELMYKVLRSVRP
jgi:lysozyme family protein